MEKSKYKIQKRVDEKNNVIFDLLKEGEVIYSASEEYVLKDILGYTNGLIFTDQVVMENINKYDQKFKEERIREIENRYKRPSSAVDGLFLIFILLQLVGFFILLPQINNLFGYNLGVLGLLVGGLVLVYNITILGSILNSRNNDRNLMDRLDEVEKKLDLFKKDIKKGK